jgi:hypothetical protein
MAMYEAPIIPPSLAYMISTIQAETNSVSSRAYRERSVAWQIESNGASIAFHSYTGLENVSSWALQQNPVSLKYITGQQFASVRITK